MNIALGTQSNIVPNKEAAQHTKLVNAAQQFEGMLLQEMLKGMQSSRDGEDGDSSSDGSNDTLRSYGTEAVAQAIAKDGGIGIARQVVAKMAAKDNVPKVSELSLKFLNASPMNLLRTESTHEQ